MYLVLFHQHLYSTNRPVPRHFVTLFPDLIHKSCEKCKQPKSNVHFYGNTGNVNSGNDAYLFQYENAWQCTSTCARCNYHVFVVFLPRKRAVTKNISLISYTREDLSGTTLFPVAPRLPTAKRQKKREFSAR